MNNNTRTLISFDWAMKKLLRQKANFDILEGFLSELLKEDVLIQSILNPHSSKNDDNEKFNIVDILVEDSKGQVIIIELQYNREVDYFHRMLFATSKASTDYMKSGYEYQNIKKAISINLLYFELGQGQDYVYHGTTNFIGIHLKDELQLSKKQKESFVKEKVYQLFPEYYVIQINKFDDVAKTPLDEWIYFLKNTELPKSYSAKGLNLVAEKLAYEAMTPAQRIAYEKHQKYLHSEKNIVDTARDEGKEEGLEQGEKIGIKKGEKLGEHKKAIETACKMKKRGMDISLISELTGLSVSEIENLDC